MLTLCGLLLDLLVVGGGCSLVVGRLCALSFSRRNPVTSHDSNFASRDCGRKRGKSRSVHFWGRVCLNHFCWQSSTTTMNSLRLKVNTANTVDVDSPRWRYVLLHSPKAALLSPSALPFLVIFFGAGFIIGGTWNKVGTRMMTTSTSAGTPLPKTKHITSSVWANNMDVNFVDDGSSSYLRKIKPDVALPIAWLMSFPVSQ